MSAVTVRGTSIIVLRTAHLLVVTPGSGYPRHVILLRGERVTTCGESSSSERLRLNPQLGNSPGPGAFPGALATAEPIADPRPAHVLVVTEHHRSTHPPGQPLDRAAQ